MRKTLGMMLLLIGSCGLALAIEGYGAPEIDAGSAGSALALLSGALLIIRGRRAK
jgi:hypothetical protein